MRIEKQENQTLVDNKVGFYRLKIQVKEINNEIDRDMERLTMETDARDESISCGHVQPTQPAKLHTGYETRRKHKEKKILSLWAPNMVLVRITDKTHTSYAYLSTVSYTVR